jgi:hypothetical protein
MALSFVSLDANSVNAKEGVTMKDCEEIAKEMQSGELDRATIYYADPRLRTRTEIDMSSIKIYGRHVSITASDSAWTKLEDIIGTGTVVNDQKNRSNEIHWAVFFEKAGRIVYSVGFDAAHDDDDRKFVSGFLQQQKVDFSTNVPRAMETLLPIIPSSK